ncbi:glycosyltransferase family 2 protein [Noviherbaspirillum sp.]|uniref:glycosyltransferase family 2 protein n=1 Tax=Noviherbaspirillum sp. TaxID=1926288 RepID=UPI002FE35626
MLISVIVTTYNRPDALAAVLRGLLAQTDPDFEVIIADDGSTDATRAMIDGFRPLPAGGPKRLVHAWQPDDGFRASAARNLGVHASKGEYLIFLDGDCIPRPDFVARHRLLAERGFMVSGSRVLLSERFTAQLLSQQPPAAIHARRFSYWLLQRLAGHANKAIPLLSFPNSRLRHYRSVKWSRIKSCNLAIWRSDYAAVNGFDESFVGWGHEDADLVLRLARHGVRRKGGAFSTEVFHLWHPENTRATESVNRKRVEERMRTGLIRAEIGLCDHPAAGERVIA